MLSYPKVDKTEVKEKHLKYIKKKKNTYVAKINGKS